MQELLEGNLRWQMVLAQTARSIESIQEHFEEADSVLILLQDDPDPDAIASGLALKQVLGRNKQTTTIGSFGRVTRPENIAMAKLLEIEVEQLTPQRCEEFDRIALVDLQPPHIRAELPRIDLVVDHHPEQFGYETTIRDVRPDYGATATILLEYLLCMGNNVGTRLATALLYGIKSDTFLLGRETNKWDVEAFSYVYPLANQNLLRRIERPELPPAAIDALGRALKTRQISDKVAFVNLGRVEREDLIPQIADFCLQFEGIEWAVVSGIFESNLVISVRNVGYVRAAGKVLKDAFGHLGVCGVDMPRWPRRSFLFPRFAQSGKLTRATLALSVRNCSGNSSEVSKVQTNEGGCSESLVRRRSNQRPGTLHHRHGPRRPGRRREERHRNRRFESGQESRGTPCF